VVVCGPMIPTDYRLEHVTVRVIDRLEGARRSFAADKERAAAEFRRIAEEMVEAAIGEYGAVAVEEPSAHAAFLRREVLDTLIPRYTRVAVDMTAREDSGYGAGFFANPAGRVALAGLALVVAFFEFKAGGARLGVTGVALFAILPFVPDALRYLWRRRHEHNLQEIVNDMARIQTQSDAYTNPDRLRVEPIGQSTAHKPHPTDVKEN
jgi:hypothetical protein